MSIHSARSKCRILTNFMLKFSTLLSDFFLYASWETLNKMWKKLDLEQFLEKYGQNLNSQKTTEKIKNQSKSSRFSPEEELVNPEPKLNLALKKCNYCQSEILIKDFGNHITKTCKNLPNSINFIIDGSETPKKKKK